jgi:TonB family protein
MIKHTFILLLTIFFSKFVICESADLSSNQNDLQEFKKSQKCYSSSVAKEDWQVALLCAKISLEVGKDIFDSGDKKITAVTHNYGLMLAKNKSYKKAVDTFKKARKLYRKNYGKNSELEGWLLLDMAESQVYLNSNRAAKNYKKALEILSPFESFTKFHRAKISLDASINLSGATNLNKKSSKIALELSSFAHNFFSGIYDDENKDTALSAFVTGKLHYLRGNDKLAQEFLEKSLLNYIVEKYAHAILIDIHTNNGDIHLAKKHELALGKVFPSLNETSKYKPIFVKDPSYPKRAMARNIGGYAIVSFTINKNGGVDNPILFEENPKNMGFGREALKVANQLKFLPQIKNGEVVTVPNVSYKYTFFMRDESVRIR